jgi:hypothetical protein|tara:strand:+ start:273 stop:557 length:285 start_codon:yes stop_codon:yes gene_type:complete
MKSKAEITTDLEQLKAQAEDRKWRQLNRAINAFGSDIFDGYTTLADALGALEMLRDNLGLPSFFRDNPHKESNGYYRQVMRMLGMNTSHLEDLI